MLHGFGGNHATALAGLTPAQAVALAGADGASLPPMALVHAVAAISPAIWTSYAQARAANAGAYASAAAFTANDAVTQASALAGMPVRVAAGYGDPFYPGVQALAAALPAGSVADFSKGCHDGPFFTAQEPASLQFLARNLA